MTNKKRISKELIWITKDPPAGCIVELAPDKDLCHWLAVIKGPSDSPYAGGRFKLDIRLPIDYPFSPPKITFQTKIYHSGIDQDGTIAKCCFAYNWKPISKVSTALQSIINLLATPDSKYTQSVKLAELYASNQAKYYSNAAEWTKKYAI